MHGPAPPLRRSRTCRQKASSCVISGRGQRSTPQGGGTSGPGGGGVAGVIHTNSWLFGGAIAVSRHDLCPQVVRYIHTDMRFVITLAGPMIHTITLGVPKIRFLPCQAEI